MTGRLLAGLLGLCLSFPGAAEEPAVAVAASLRIAMPSLVAAFERTSGRSVRLSFASSGVLTRQIRRGAPFELFLAANTAYPERLARAGLTDGDGAIYAHGRIGLFAPHGSPIDVTDGLAGLRQPLAGGAIERFAIPNPNHAPYGIRARQALGQAGLWQAIEPVLVLGENAAQAAQFAASGSTVGGIIPASLGKAPRFAERGRFALIPATAHEPLEQRMVLLRGAGPTARALYDFLRTPRARDILRERGFSVPPTDGARP
jgi:molybdate transport system substrate-binding protein